MYYCSLFSGLGTTPSSYPDRERNGASQPNRRESTPSESMMGLGRSCAYSLMCR